MQTFVFAHHSNSHIASAIHIISQYAASIVRSRWVLTAHRAMTTAESRRTGKFTLLDCGDGLDGGGYGNYSRRKHFPFRRIVLPQRGGIT